MIVTIPGTYLRRTRDLFIGVGAAVFSACGGPGQVVDPPPTQSVQAYWLGTEETGALHFHVQFVQSGHNINLVSPCDPQDNCRIYPYSEVGNVELGTGTSFPVNIVSATGNFADPGITFTVTTVQNKTFTFTGTVTESKQMIGTISGPTHPSSRLQLDKQ
jgi:hypothetical protein